MDQEKASSRLMKSIVKLNLYAVALTAFTGLYADLFTALILFPVYLLSLALLPFMLEKGYFSRYPALQEFLEKLF